MNLPQSLQQEAEKWAQLQGMSLEAFICQAIVEKVSRLHQQGSESSRVTEHPASSEQPSRVYSKDGIMVIKTAPFELDTSVLIDEMQEERIRGLMDW